jgi:FtsP/CotA-like multicopper oxidase with cupredoxin domain
MITRRELLQRGALGGAALLVPWSVRTGTAEAAMGLKSYVTDLRPFLPPVVTGDSIKMTLQARQVALHKALAGVNVWGYVADGGDPDPHRTYLGPSIVVPKGQTTQVDFQGAFDPATTPAHLFAASIDKDVLDPYVVDRNFGDLRFMTHLHGGYVTDANDGNPFATEHEHEAGPQGLQRVTYAPQDRAAFLWYHQHAHGITHLNVMAGLAGAYIVADEQDPVVESSPGSGVSTEGFPAGEYMVPLVLQDRLIADGQLSYPPAPWVPEFFGDTILVDGAVEPFLAVSSRRYRFRVLNGSNARFYDLQFSTGDTLSRVAPTMWVIGGDGGLLPKPEQVSSLVLAPGERADLIVDFGPFSGLTKTPTDTVLLRNTPLPTGMVSPAPSAPTVMRFHVTPTSAPDPSFDPAATTFSASDQPLAQLAGTDVKRKRTMILEEIMGAAGPLGVIINYRSFEGRPVAGPQPMSGYPFDLDPAKARQLEDIVPNGDVEDWQFVNTTADSHPMHLHLVQFGIVQRQKLDTNAYMADLAVLHACGDDPAAAIASGLLSPKAKFDDPSALMPGNRLLADNYLLPGVKTVPITPEETGWKDTIRAHPGEVTTIRAKFDTTRLNVSEPQKYVVHCHILEHESNSMMRAYQVGA